MNTENVEMHAIDEIESTGWKEDVTDERMHTLGIQVERHESTIKDLHLCINGLKMEMENQQHLRQASEQALREEMSRGLRVVTEQVALRADRTMPNSPHGSASNVAHDIKQQPVQDSTVLRQEIHATATELEGSAQKLARQAANQQIELLWPVLQQQVQAVMTEVRSRAQNLARQAAEQHIALLWPTLKEQVCQKVSSGVVGSGNASAPQSTSARPRLSSFDEQQHQLLRLEENIEALRLRVNARERDSHPILAFRNQFPDCFTTRHGATPSEEGSLAS